ITDAEFMMIGSVALLNDIADYAGLDLISFRMIDICAASILGFWCYFRLKKFPAGKFGGTFLIELTPIVGDISPTWTLFILSEYLKNKKQS
ncbi:MAG: hypothetical protein U9P63_03715, partial [Patescibacteria group bacterium]|nr:hypothetical protein [Patescibacteria group bacterium]